MSSAYARAFDQYSTASEAVFINIGTNGLRFEMAQPLSATVINTQKQADFISATLEDPKVLAKWALVRQVASYADLEPEWDGYAAEPANVDSITEARIFISSLPTGCPVPRSTLASDGEISLYWDKDGRYLEASFPGDGSYHYIYTAPGIRFGSKDIHVSMPTIDPEFLAHLISI